mgnify:CR=1 FL=1
MQKASRYRGYTCDECGKRTLLPLRAFDRKTRPRCSACGSLWLTPCKNAAATLAEGHDAREAFVASLDAKAGA